MQIIYLPKNIMILSYFLGWLLLQSLVGIIIDRIPRKKINPNNFFFRTHKWEKNGLFYKKYFRVDSWKHLLPDGAAVRKSGFQKKQIKTNDPEYLNDFIRETVRAELIHWFCIPFFWIFGFWSPWHVLPIMLGYALLVNIPCIIAQRYNRPRIRKILRLLEQRNISQQHDHKNDQ